MKGEPNISISKTVKRAPNVDGRVFAKMKDAVLGRDYRLSVVWIGEKRSRRLNAEYRGKNRPTDILSFPLGKNEGEIFLNPKRSAVEAKKFGRGFENFLYFLFIHGLCHLKGLEHGSKMERTEAKYRKLFDV